MRRIYTVKAGKWKLCLSTLIVVLCLLFYVGLQMYILSLEKHVLDIKRERSVLEKEVKKYEIEKAELRRGSRIKKIATEQLGLVMPEGAPRTLY
ncbi:cell division protein FtsL [Candidatus Latescibacterota bacterium]